MLTVLNDTKVTFLNHSVINFVDTRDERFSAHLFDAFQNLIKRSTQLSVASEKQRTRFFNRIREKNQTGGEMVNCFLHTQ